MHLRVRALEFAFSGGATLFFLIFWLLFKPFDVFSLSASNGYIYLIASLVAFTIYQPHFIFSYFASYSKGLPFLQKNWKEFILIPVILFTVFLVFFIDLMYFNFVPLQFIQGLLYFTLIMISWHFSSQSVALIMFYSKTLKGEAHAKRNLRLLFFATFLFAIYSCSAELGYYPFYHLPTLKLSVSPTILSASRVCFLSVHLLFFLIYRKEMVRFSLVPWGAFLAWTLTSTFTKEFFYLVPLFHGIEVIPFYLKSHAEKKTIINEVCDDTSDFITCICRHPTVIYIVRKI